MGQKKTSRSYQLICNLIACVIELINYFILWGNAKNAIEHIHSIATPSPKPNAMLRHRIQKAALSAVVFSAAAVNITAVAEKSDSAATAQSDARWRCYHPTSHRQGVRWDEITPDWDVAFLVPALMMWCPPCQWYYQHLVQPNPTHPPATDANLDNNIASTCWVVAVLVPVLAMLWSPPPRPALLTGSAESDAPPHNRYWQ